HARTFFQAITSQVIDLPGGNVGKPQVEHPFRVIKRQFGYTKVRYRGLAKNTAQVLMLFALSNLWMKRKQLLPAMGSVRL
ncbi:transposase, partial [Xanthomonas campestris pv. campestris]|nr:transposase [Xanthomonas campestris pv. campestris]